MTTIEELKKAATCIYITAEEEVAREISLLLNKAAAELEALQRKVDDLQTEVKFTRELHSDDHQALNEISTKVCGAPTFGWREINRYVDTLRTQNRVLRELINDYMSPSHTIKWRNGGRQNKP